MSPSFFSAAPRILEMLRVHAEIPTLIGCSSNGLIGGAEELEQQAAIAVGLYSLPNTQVYPYWFNQQQLDEANGPGFWHLETGLSREDLNGWLAFADPFHLDCERWLRGWNEAYAPLPIFGGLASGPPTEQVTQVYLNEEVRTEGGVAIALAGDTELTGVISQGCTPIGETWTITRAEENVIHEIGNRPAYEMLAETFRSLPKETQQKTRGNLFVGLVVDEYKEDFRRGDFLVRNLIGADPRSGAIAIGARPRNGQTIQFHRRDAEAATEDMSWLLEATRKRLMNRKIYGGCLCSCLGRGSGLFRIPNHDIGQVRHKLGDFGLAGFFCNGEIGPIGDRNFLHGYTASLALFTSKQPSD